MRLSSTTPLPLTRRTFLGVSSAALFGATVGASRLFGADHKGHGTDPYTLPDLPYAEDALTPHIDARTMSIHHGKHHAGYVRKLNAAIKATGMEVKEPVEELITHLDDIPSAQRTAVRCNGGGHANHSLFWEVMSPDGGGEPKGLVGKMIDDQFGSFAKFREAFTGEALGRFGSGWAWLAVDSEGQLFTTSTPNQDSPLMAGFVERTGNPILGLDVWEHAYYLHYQNRRADYVKAFWNVVNWAAVEERLVMAQS